MNENDIYGQARAEKIKNDKDFMEYVDILRSFNIIDKIIYVNSAANLCRFYNIMTCSFADFEWMTEKNNQYDRRIFIVLRDLYRDYLDYGGMIKEKKESISKRISTLMKLRNNDIHI